MGKSRLGHHLLGNLVTTSSLANSALGLLLLYVGAVVLDHRRLTLHVVLGVLVRDIVSAHLIRAQGTDWEHLLLGGRIAGHVALLKLLHGSLGGHGMILLLTDRMVGVVLNGPLRVTLGHRRWTILLWVERGVGVVLNRSLRATLRHRGLTALLLMERGVGVVLSRSLHIALGHRDRMTLLRVERVGKGLILRTLLHVIQVRASLLLLLSSELGVHGIALVNLLHVSRAANGLVLLLRSEGVANDVALSIGLLTGKGVLHHVALRMLLLLTRVASNEIALAIVLAVGEGIVLTVLLVGEHVHDVALIGERDVALISEGDIALISEGHIALVSESVVHAVVQILKLLLDPLVGFLLIHACKGIVEVEIHRISTSVRIVEDVEKCLLQSVVSKVHLSDGVLSHVVAGTLGDVLVGERARSEVILLDILTYGIVRGGLGELLLLGVLSVVHGLSSDDLLFLRNESGLHVLLLNGNLVLLGGGDLARVLLSSRCLNRVLVGSSRDGRGLVRGTIALGGHGRRGSGFLGGSRGREAEAAEHDNSVVRHLDDW